MIRKSVALTLSAAAAAVFFGATPAPAEVPGIMGRIATLYGGGVCAKDMVEVLGDYCPFVEEICARWVDNEVSKDRCAEYRTTRRCIGTRVHKRFCIDRFEYPNKEGMKPVVAVSWDDARATCESQGKRLCKDSEWTLACEGQERLPYPYGYARDATACNIDRPYIRPNDAALHDPATRALEIARLDQRDASGARAACVSPFGVHDMTGNVDEWVVNERGMPNERPYASALKGGYWGPVRDRCRPMTTDHNQWHIGYQIGFRCCS